MGHRGESSDAKPHHPVMTVEGRRHGPKPPRANLNGRAKTVVNMWDGPELLTPDLSKLLMLRTCGMVQSCSSWGARADSSKANQGHRVIVVQRMWMVQSCSNLICRSYSCCAQVGLPRVAQAWSVEAACARGPELLKSNLSKLLMLSTCQTCPSKTAADV